LKPRYFILILIFITTLSACSQNSNKDERSNRVQTKFQNSSEISSSEINSFQDYRLTSDLNNDGQIDSARLLYDNTLLLEINDKTIELGNIDSHTYEDLFSHDLYKEFPTVFKVIMGDDKQKYILLAYPIMGANTDGIEYKTYLIKYDDKGISLIWNGEPPEYDYEYADNKIKFKYLDTQREVVGDITAKVEKIKSEYLRIAPMTIEEFFNGQLIIFINQLNCIDYDGDGNDEIVTVYTIENEQLAWRLARMYTVWEIHDGKIQAKNGIIPVSNSVESGILTQIMKNGYFNVDELQNFIKQNYPDENENYSIEILLQNAIYKMQKTLLTFNCE
jgi:hypothetical protein